MMTWRWIIENEIEEKLMNNRTIRKGLVELGAGLAVTVISWGIDSAAGLGASPALLALVIPAALTVRRMIRDRFLGANSA